MRSRTAREVRKNRTWILIEYSSTFEPHLIVSRKQFFRLPLVPAWEHEVCATLLLRESHEGLKNFGIMYHIKNFFPIEETPMYTEFHSTVVTINFLKNHFMKATVT